MTQLSTALSAASIIGNDTLNIELLATFPSHAVMIPTLLMHQTSCSQPLFGFSKQGQTHYPLLWLETSYPTQNYPGTNHTTSSSLTTSLQKDSCLQQCNQKTPNPWTCNGTGSNAGQPKTSSNTNGNKVLTTMQTITANKMQNHIINKYAINCPRHDTYRPTLI